MEEDFGIIKTAPIFAGIDGEETKTMLGCLGAKMQTYGKGDYLLRVGDRVEEVGLLLSGRVLIVQEDFWGNRNLISQVPPGQIFAATFACSPGAVLDVSVVSDKPCRVLWLNVQRILTTCPTACSHHSRMVRNLLSDLADKNLRFHEKLTHMGQRTTRDKLLSYLSAQARRQGSAEFDISFSRQQLADYLSVERTAMSAQLSKLREDGVLTFEKNHFHLREPEK